MRLKFNNDSEHDLDSVGFDTTTFSAITEQEIRAYFTGENWRTMFGSPISQDETRNDWNDIVDFESYIEAAISECESIGKLSEVI